MLLPMRMRAVALLAPYRTVSPTALPWMRALGAVANRAALDAGIALDANDAALEAQYAALLAFDRAAGTAANA